MGCGEMKVVMERKGEKADNQAPWNGVSENQTQRKKNQAFSWCGVSHL
jgi:hypothetical protein